MQPTLRWRTDAARGPSDAEPLAGLRVSWGAVVSGTVAALATALLLWGLAAAVVLTIADVTSRSLRAGLVALWLSAMATVVIGSLCGGAIAGWLSGNRSRAIAVTHAFLAWALSFLVSAFGQLMTFAWLARRGAPPDLRGLLTWFGYSRQEAAAVLTSARGELQGVLRGGWAGARPRGAAELLLDGTAGMAWTYYGTWLFALLFAIAGGLAVHRRTRPRELEPIVPPRGEHDAHARPDTPTLTPAE